MSEDFDVFENIKDNKRNFERDKRDWERERYELQQKSKEAFDKLKNEVYADNNEPEVSRDAGHGIFGKIKKFFKDLYHAVSNYFQEPKKEVYDKAHVERNENNPTTDVQKAKELLRNLTKEDRAFIKDHIRKQDNLEVQGGPKQEGQRKIINAGLALLESKRKNNIDLIKDKEGELKLTKEDKTLIKDTVKKYIKDKNIDVTAKPEEAKKLLKYYTKLAKRAKKDIKER